MPPTLAGDLEFRLRPGPPRLLSCLHRGLPEVLIQPTFSVGLDLGRVPRYSTPPETRSGRAGLQSEMFPSLLSQVAELGCRGISVLIDPIYSCMHPLVCPRKGIQNAVVGRTVFPSSWGSSPVQVVSCPAPGFTSNQTHCRQLNAAGKSPFSKTCLLVSGDLPSTTISQFSKPLAWCDDAPHQLGRGIREPGLIPERGRDSLI